MSVAKKIVVVGAGAAGVSCAISVAARGASVTLIEKTPHLGGTVAHSLIHTIGGLYDDAGEYINEGLPVKLTELLLQASVQTRKRKMGKVWTLSVDPVIYEDVLETWVANLPNITVLRNARVTKVQTDVSLLSEIEVTSDNQRMVLRPDHLVDTTGNAEVVRLLDANKVVAGDALAGLIFAIRGVAEGALAFPKNIGVQRNVKKAIDEGVLPTELTRTWFDEGVYDDEVYAKANILTTSYQPDAIPCLQEKLIRFLRDLPDFEKAHVVRVGRLGVRDGGRIKGNYCLTLEDVEAGRQFDDSVGRCAWPIEYWDPQKGVTLDYHPPGHFYEIPLRALQVAGMNNMWAAGKCFSAEKLAQASARVAGTCWAMGDGLGKALTTQL